MSNSLWSEDLAPIAREDRVVGPARLFWAWLTMGVSVPAWLLASGLIVAGMTGLEALGTMLLGSVIALVVAWLCGHAGAKYGIPSSVLMRASFGVVGAQVPAVVRALVSCAWFGIQCWIGGLALFAMLRLRWPGIGGDARYLCFAVFWVVSVALGMFGLRKAALLQRISVALLMAVGLELLCWTVGRTAGAGHVWNTMQMRPAENVQAIPFGRLFGPSLTGVVGFWSLIALSASDLSCHAKRLGEQAVGVRLGLPVMMMVYAAISVVVMGATLLAGSRPEAIWNPIDLLASLPLPAAGFGLAALVLGTLAGNVTMHVEGPAAAFSSLMRGQISFRTGVLMTGLLSLLSMPWLLVTDPARYLSGWLLGVSGVLGPIAGVMVADYFVLRRRSVDVEGLYVRAGEYEYSNGFNIKGIQALTAGVIVAEAGLFLPQLHRLYEYAWFVGFGVAAVVYLLLMRVPIERAMIPPTPLLIPMQGFEGEGA